jgi:glycerol-3-phosphate dehydrogenase
MLTSRGSHIVLKEQLCPAGLGLLVPSTDDGRVLFMLPFFGRTLVGTTDEACPQEMATHPTDVEQAYLLDYVQRWFPGTSATVTSRWAGGRPLLKPAGAGLDSSRVVREHEVETLPCGLVSVMGGKWTTCRPMALDTLEAVEQQLGAPLSTPQRLPLIGAAETPDQTDQQLAQQRLALEALLEDSPRRQQQIAHLLGSHGLNAQPLIESAPPADRVPLSGVIPICAAEIHHAIRHEHARAADDVLSRRCRLGMVDEAEAMRLQPLVEQALDAAGINPGA